MPETSDYHARAMDLAFAANREQNHNDPATADQSFQLALINELAAITLLDQKTGAGTTTLLRSAGWLAIDCNFPELAMDLAQRGLDSEPPQYIRGELQTLLKHASSEADADRRHLGNGPIPHPMFPPEIQSAFTDILRAAQEDVMDTEDPGLRSKE